MAPPPNATDASDSAGVADVAALARLLRDLDDERPGTRETLRALYACGGGAFVVGVTGHPGVGKSTLVDGLIGAYRAGGERVAVVAVDPSSPFSGGALLGDRVRMQRHATDDGVFIRSLASRGRQGGLSRSTTATVAAFDAAGFPVVIVETVGAGQAEVDVADAADAVVVVTAPGLGDEIQALKVGLLEIADVLVVNKADRDGADRALADLHTMIALAARPAGRREPALIRAVAPRGEGLPELLAALEALRHLPADERAARRRRQVVRQVTAIAGERAWQVAERAMGDASVRGPLASIADQVAARTLDPWTAAEILAGGPPA